MPPLLLLTSASGIGAASAAVITATTGSRGHRCGAFTALP